MKTQLRKINKEQIKLDDTTIKKMESFSEDEINSILRNSCKNFRIHKYKDRRR